MDSRRRFRPRFVYVMTPQGTLEQRRSGCVDWPSNRVDAPLKERRDGTASARGNPNASLLESTVEKSLGWQCMKRPYRKPTQVGEASSLR
jgi:hypothetical protein